MGYDEHGVLRPPQELSAHAARIFQHEMDHLDGILYTERIDYTTEGVLLPDVFFDRQEEWDDDLFISHGFVPPSIRASRTEPGWLAGECVNRT